MDGGDKLGLDVLDLGVADLVVGVEGYVNHYKGYVQLNGEVLIPLYHAVADVVAAEQEVRLGHVLLGDVLVLGVGQADTGVGADVVGVACGFALGAHALAAAARGDGSGLVLRVTYGKAEGLGNLNGEVAGAPAYRLSPVLCRLGVGIRFCRNLIQLVLRGIGVRWGTVLFNLFCHSTFLLSTYVDYLLRLL